MSNNEAGELFARLATRACPHTDYTFPIRKEGDQDVKCVLRILSESEFQRACSNAQKVADYRCKESPTDTANHAHRDGWQEIYNDQKIVEVLAIALMLPGYPDKKLSLVPDAKSLSEALTSDEVGVCFQAYQALRAEAGPIISALSADECEAYLKVLVEGGSRHPLSRLSSAAITDLLMHSVSTMKSFATITGSPGSPVEESQPSMPSDPIVPPSELV